MYCMRFKFYKVWKITSLVFYFEILKVESVETLYAKLALIKLSMIKDHVIFALKEFSWLIKKS